jgi:hypothetical protein
MNYNSRIRQIERKSTTGKGEVHISVSGYDSDDNFDEEYAVHRARQVLGLMSFDERTIFVCGPETKARYEDMTPEQAKKILSGRQTIENNDKKDLQK